MYLYYFFLNETIHIINKTIQRTTPRKLIVYGLKTVSQRFKAIYS